MAAGRTATPLGPAGTQSLDPGAGMWVGWLLFARRRVGWGGQGREDCEGTRWKVLGGDIALRSAWTGRWEGDPDGRAWVGGGPGRGRGGASEGEVAGRGPLGRGVQSGRLVWGLRLGAESGQEEVQVSPAPVTVENTPRVRSLGRDGGPGRVQRSRPGSAPCPGRGGAAGPRGAGRLTTTSPLWHSRYASSTGFSCGRGPGSGPAARRSPAPSLLRGRGAGPRPRHPCQVQTASRPKQLCPPDPTAPRCAPPEPGRPQHGVPADPPPRHTHPPPSAPRSRESR